MKRPGAALVLLVAWGLLVPSAAWPQGAGKGADPASGAQVVTVKPFNERLSQDVPVSGRLVVGAVVAPASDAPWQPQQGLHLGWRALDGAADGVPLCIALSSRDGNYFGEGELTAALKPGWPQVTLAHQGKAMVDYLSGLPPDDLAMLATLGPCRQAAAAGTAPPARLTLYLIDAVARRDGALPSQAARLGVRLMLNTLTYTLSVSASAQGQDQAVSCRKLDEARRNKAYNLLCDLQLPAAAGEAEVLIGRRRYERGFEPVPLRLVWARP